MNPVVLQCPNHFKTRAISHVCKPRIFVAAKIALENASVVSAIEHRAPGFEFANAIRRFLGVKLGHTPIVHILTATHRVGEMDLPVVAVVDIGERGRDSAFRHHRMRFAEEYLQTSPTGRQLPTLRSLRASPRRRSR